MSTISPELNQALDHIRVITHSAIRLENNAGTVVYCDPFGLTDAESTHDASIILITHTHYDHLSDEDLKRVINKNTVIVAPASAAENIKPYAAYETHLVQAGDELELAGITVSAVCAYNTDPSRLQKHPQANGWLGYIVDLDGVRVYIAGDTDQNTDNEQVTCDIALIPIGGTFTMDPHQAATFINTITPKVAIPTHYGNIVGTRADGTTFAQEVDPTITIVEKLER